MDDSETREIYCPNCRNHVAPVRAAVAWYCPRCAWQFSEREVQRAAEPPPAEEPSDHKTAEARRFTADIWLGRLAARPM